eukprot:TRINITY_DN1995_c0_g1_i4.p2 TRINITY_DN1995_c0_g1~~TRINITY_DN1995_c0_g1_i4.p2  ORF type:complete len:136 (+),score=16.13 TRINITY_DN1995_c0_g1_i4:255-662(+)
MNQDAMQAYDFIMFNLTNEYQQEDIFLVGRSLGSGPAVYLASNIANIGGLILISSLYSVKKVVSNKVGSLLAQLTPDIFKNYQLIEKVTCPLLMIHGSKDTLIPISQAERLYQKCSSEVKEFVIRPDMDLSLIHI